MSDQIGAKKMRDLGSLIKKQIPGLGFVLLVFEFNKPSSMANYISNAQREDMIKGLEETIKRFKAKEDHSTPEEN